MAHHAEEGELRIANSDLAMILVVVFVVVVVASCFAAAVAASSAPRLAAVASSAPGWVGLHMDEDEMGPNCFWVVYWSREEQANESLRSLAALAASLFSLFCVSNSM